MALARLRKELKDLVSGEDVSGVAATPRGDDLTRLQGTFKGPEGTPYEGGVFFVDIVIPQQYPFEPPKMKFETKIWHPNICEGAAVGEQAASWSLPYYHAPCISLGSIYNGSCFEDYPL